MFLITPLKSELGARCAVVEAMATAAVDRAQAAGEDPTAAAASGSSLVMASQPGFLTLAPLRAQQLVAQDSLEQWYTLENQPFAR